MMMKGDEGDKHDFTYMILSCFSASYSNPLHPHVSLGGNELHKKATVKNKTKLEYRLNWKFSLNCAFVCAVSKDDQLFSC